MAYPYSAAACSVAPPGPSGSGDHGDKTAGTAAAVTNNRISSQEATWICDHLSADTSVAGTSWFSKIMIARMLDDWDIIDAIAYAINEGAKIISMSWSDTLDNPMLHTRLDEAWNAGLLLIASAGNQSYERPRYPAAYENVIAVAGTDSNDVKAYGSNYGTWVDICAPWWNKAPDRDNKFWDRYCYDNFAGTSASAPFVAGVAAMVWSCNLSATNAEVRDALENTADYICGIPGNFPYCPNKLGHGRVNALEAVKVFRPVPPAPGDCNADGIVDLGDVLWLRAYLYIKNAPPPDPLCVGDVNDDGIIDLGDMMYLISYLYKGGPPPLDGCD